MDVKRAISRLVVLGLMASVVVACAEEPQATIYEAEESQLPSIERSFASAAELVEAAEPILGYACEVEEGTDIVGMEYATCDPDPSDGSAGVRLSVGLDEQAAAEAAEHYWSLNRGMNYTVIQDDNWVVSGPSGEVRALHADLSA